MPTKTVQPSWVKEFRKAVKASTQKGWLVIQGKKESTRGQIRKDGKKIADNTIPYAWRESDWPDSLMRIKGAVKVYEKSGQKLDLKTCFNIAHKVSSETEIDLAEALVAYRKSKGKKEKIQIGKTNLSLSFLISNMKLLMVEENTKKILRVKRSLARLAILND